MSLVAAASAKAAPLAKATDLKAAAAQALSVLSEGKAWETLVALRMALSDGDGE
ncbi:MAG: hypothetical protein ACPGPH_07150 [Synechococcus sp.]